MINNRLTVLRLVSRFCCSEGDICSIGALVARHGRGLGACRDWLQGGVKGGFRSIAIPRWRLVVTYAVRPWELRRFDALRGVG